MCENSHQEGYMKLKGKRAIVTGSSSGIGRSIAIRLAAEGARVVVNARGSRAEGAQAIFDVVGAIKDSGGEAVGISGSVDDPAFAKALVEGCVDAFGGVDILINNAGAYIGSEPITDCSIEDWRSSLRVNLDSVFLMSREVLPYMRKQRWGRVINAASSAGLGGQGGTGYTAAKSALFGLTRGISADYGPYGITANCYNPEARGIMGGTQDDAVFKGVIEHFRNRGYMEAAALANLATIGGPDGIAPWIAYLCTDHANYLNGQVFAVEDRRVSLLHEPDETRVLYKDSNRRGPFALYEFERLAPMVFQTVNRWPQRYGQALDDWEKA
jgi:3-oxoacyl-[acyl-carrier protein] reductase